MVHICSLGTKLLVSRFSRCSCIRLPYLVDLTVSTSGWVKLVSAPFRNGVYPMCACPRSAIQKVALLTPQACRVTFSPATTGRAAPTHRPLWLPNGDQLLS